jgi:uncharacterized protein (DUF983 family)
VYTPGKVPCEADISTFFWKGFIALVSKGGTCGVTKLFRNNNQFAAVFLQLFIGKLDTGNIMAAKTSRLYTINTAPTFWKTSSLAEQFVSRVTR